jgi:hypothetical protein
MYCKKKKKFGAIRKSLRIFIFKKKLFLKKNFKKFSNPSEIFFCFTVQKLFLGQIFFVPEKKVVSLKKNGGILIDADSGPPGYVL